MPASRVIGKLFRFTSAMGVLTVRDGRIVHCIEHASRRIRVLGVTAHPTAEWTTQTARNLIMDLHDASAPVKYLIRDRDNKYTPAFDTVFKTEGIQITPTGIRIPRMEA